MNLNLKMYNIDCECGMRKHPRVSTTAATMLLCAMCDGVDLMPPPPAQDNASAS